MSISRPPHLISVYDRYVVEETVSVLRHDLRNKVAAVRNAAYYVRKKFDAAPPTADPRVTQMLDVMKTELQATEELLSARKWPGADEAREARIASAMEHLIGTLAPEVAARIDVVENLDGTVGVGADELEVAFYCLLENGLDAALTNGRVTVRAHLGPDEQARIEIADDGPGWSEEAARRHLEPFFTTHPERLGLGLNIARRVAHRAMGALTLSAGAPRGVRAVLDLPRRT